MADAVHSMTGAGAATASSEVGSVTVEVRAVNHRFLKTTVRGPVAAPGAEGAVAERIRQRLHRGHVTAFVRFVASREGLAASVDETAFAEVASRLRALARKHRLWSPSVSDVLRVPGVRVESSPEDLERVLPLVLEAVDGALLKLQAGRRREGEMLTAEIRGLLDSIVDHADAIEARAQHLPAAAQARLEGSLAELSKRSGVTPDPDQVAREIALLADRMDIREEIMRLGAHVVHAREVLAEGGAVGRQLDFLVQEMHRESNTIGSKAADAELSRHVVDLKSDVERLREQVQNIE